MDGRIASMPTGTGIECIKFLKVNSIIGKLIKAWLEHEITSGNFSDEDKQGKANQLDTLFTLLDRYSEMAYAQENGEKIINRHFTEDAIVSLIGDLFEVDLTNVSPLKTARAKKFKWGHPLLLPEDGLAYSSSTPLTSSLSKGRQYR